MLASDGEKVDAAGWLSGGVSRATCLTKFYGVKKVITRYTNHFEAHVAHEVLGEKKLKRKSDFHSSYAMQNRTAGCSPLRAAP